MLNQVICTRILTIYFSSVFDSDEERKPLQEKDFSSEYVCCLIYSCPYWGQSILWQSVNILCWTICWIKHERHMTLVLIMSLLLRVYFLIRCTHNALWWVILNRFDSTISYIWLYLLSMARSARFVLLGDLYTFSVLHGLYCLLETWVVRVLKVTVIPDCPVL
jgi:hypothetical protein